MKLQKIDHQNIIKYYGYSESVDVRTNNFYIFIELIQGNELFDYIIDIKNKTKIIEKNIIAKQLLDGLNYLHMQKIYHRDIKPENIMLDYKSVSSVPSTYPVSGPNPVLATTSVSGPTPVLSTTSVSGPTPVSAPESVSIAVTTPRSESDYLSTIPIAKYIDFGFSCTMDLTCNLVNPIQFSSLYVSPEYAKILIDKRIDRSLFPYFDMWALGCTLFSLYTSSSLYHFSQSDRYFFEKVANVNQSFIDRKIDKYLTDDNIDPVIKNAIRDLLMVDHTQRKITLI